MSIEFTTTVDLESCAREPIHVPGTIQPHGILLACSPNSWLITHVSESAIEFFGRAAPADILDQPLDQIFSAKVVHDLRNTLQAAMVSGGAEVLSEITVGSGSLCDIAIHLSGGSVIIEVLPRAGAQSPTPAPLALVRSMLTRLKRAPNLDRALTLSTTQIRAVTGFDRVMIYKFLADGTGQVVAEALRAGLTPFLGLHYPASDIPSQARELYKRQWLRLIPDVSYEPSPIWSSDSGSETLDLSLASLRSVSPIHLEYLRNMGSAATLTISIITGDRLWGLIACHHEAPRRLATSTCSACELFGQIFSLHLEAQEQARELAYIAASREAHERLIASMPPEETLFDNLARYRDLLAELIPSDGIGLWTTGVFSGVGVLPPLEAMPRLIEFLSTKDAQEVFVTDRLASVFPEAAAYADRVSGLIALPFSRAPRDYLIFFRRELLQVVNWGGNPNKPVEPSPDGGRIGPRKSFAAWREEVRGRSRSWSEAEAKIAEALRVSLLDVILRRADLVERERRSAQESQALLIAELNHRVKNILALIRSVVRQSRHGATSVSEFTTDLETRIRALSLAHDQMTKSNWSWAPIRGLIEAEAEVWTRDSGHALKFEGPNALLDSKAYQTLALVFHELMTNAAKYGALSTPSGVLNLRWAYEGDGALEIVWHEQGGPPVKAPKRRGFGSTVVEQAIPFELQGEAKIEYRFDGVWARFLVPKTYTIMGEVETERSVERFNQPDNLRGKRLLLVEDSMMIALDAQSSLQEAGITVEICGTTADAKRAIEVNRFDGVILDINVSGETSFSVADLCETKRLPFVFATGYGESVIMPERFSSVPLVPKPYDEGTLRTALSVATKSAASDEVR